MDSVIHCGTSEHATCQSYVATICSISVNSEQGQYELSIKIDNKLITAVVDYTSGDLPEDIEVGSRVQIEGWWKAKAWNSALVIQKLSLQSDQLHKTSENQFQIAPHESLEQLLQLLRPPLRDFIEGILESEIGYKFLTLSASMNHHHSWSEGLLTHSVECTLMAGQLAMTWLNRAEAELTMVAALLHDIGKCGTFEDTKSHADLSRYVTHEAYTLELLAPHLADLEVSWPIGANMLRHMLSHDTRTKAFPAFPGTLLVKMADHFSTAMDRRRALFEESPEYQHYAYDSEYRQKYLRVPR